MQHEPFRVFWQPGCSACVRLKEFLTELEVPFESVNVLTDAQGRTDLAALGARSLPVLSRGKSFVFGQSLSQVSEFVGKKPDLDQSLSAQKLMERWFYFLDVARGLIEAIPADKLAYQPVPGRERTIRGLSYHIYQIPDAFLQTVQEGVEDWGRVANLRVSDNVVSSQDIIRYADSVIARLHAFWDGLDDKSCKWTVKTFYGVRPAHELLERQTWHSAQHIRQLQALLDEFDIKLAMPVDPNAYKGLPMPKGLWE
ncbi:MAG: DinB family protein [Rhizobiaceae bacterium]|nr:DinB family protein [Rhizobiaceae bacterium]